MPEFPLSLQLYTVRNEAEADLPGTLASLAEIGYRSVELAGMYGLSATEFKKLLSDNGLESPAAHVGVEAMQSDGVAKVLEDYGELGSRSLVISSLPPEWRDSDQAYARSSEVMNEIGARLHSQGFQLAYHNHDFEFAMVVGDKSGYDLLLEYTDPDLVKLEFDTYWALYAGQDPVEIIKQNADRISLLHIKDMDGTDRLFAPVGTGILPLDAILDAVKAAGDKYLIVEQDSCKQPPLEAVEISYKTLKQKGYS